ncbi:hypothetical protein [Streptomyces sp. NPDC001714]|uniref:hypothetical protein n=1 Tax=Streptomyces sp. NPDC001714 TaxID=3364603 RepID=UPI00369626EA
MAGESGGVCAAVGERVFDAIDALGTASAAELAPGGPIGALPAARSVTDRWIDAA